MLICEEYLGGLKKPVTTFIIHPQNTYVNTTREILKYAKKTWFLLFTDLYSSTVNKNIETSLH